MDAGDGTKGLGAFERRLRGLADEAGAGAKAAPPEAGASRVAKSLLFLIDTASEQLLHLRKLVAGEAEVAPAAPPAAATSKSIFDTVALLLAQILKAPESVAVHYAEFAREALRILENGSELKPEPRDFRFKDRAWRESPLLRSLVQLYLAWGGSMQSWLAEQQLDEADKRRIAFLFQQLVAAMAPSNLPLNPAALRRAESTEGRSMVDGLIFWMEDVIHNHAMPRQIRPRAYEIGKDLAITPGAVVYRSEQLELIQYAPQTATVHSRPVLLIPPQINKYYVLDLKPQNSIIGHLLQSGLQIFTLSWRNPTAAQAHWNLESYIGAILEAMDAVSDITKSRTMSLISACAGAFTAVATMGYLACTGQRRIASHSLLVTSLLPNNGSDLELFATPQTLETARRYVRTNGVMEGKDLAKIFFWLRADDLVWRYWINNYLLGRTPPPLDVLFWDNDSTRLPAGLHGNFLDLYINDVFQRPNTLQLFGKPIDFNRVCVDTYFVGGEDDYLMPWQGCYRTAQAFRGRHEFVLSTSGHVQSLLRPPRLANMHYYTNTHMNMSAKEWRESCVRREGSWWAHWHGWLNAKSGALKRAPSHLGSPDHPVIMPAPGSYVLQ